MKFYTCRSDIVFKAIVCNNEDKTILKAVLKNIFDKEFENIEILNPELSKPSVLTKSKTVDLLLKDNEKTIIVELNGTYHNPSRNFAYLCNEVATRTKVGKDYDPNYMFCQVNLSYTLKDDFQEDYRISYVQDDNCNKFVENISIIEYNMGKLRKYYEEDNKEMIDKYQYLIMLDLDDQELNILNKKDGVIMEYIKKVTDINKNDEYIPYLTVEEDDEKFMNTIKKQAKREGVKEGIQEERNRSIKAFFESGASLELISKANGITVEEVKKIIES